ncbi:hypothetical protein [Schumannella sp. 10F1B-5-1]|uniref:hypothetical protein n=1 Tax=Schumannella sp. 10F1B-5-1 TaxID=2590780 RepID=UPI00113232E2|nr:hypothetical protein [Schumannella sp. 10F1B-5-1]TPW71645.1 hypothetical protein FJ658_09840 [Schumannella sp. 10F1B-5-1]
MISSAQLARDRAVGRVAAVAIVVVAGVAVLVGPVGTTVGGAIGFGPMPWFAFLLVPAALLVLTFVTWTPGRRNVGTPAQGRVLLGITPGGIAAFAGVWGVTCFVTSGQVPFGSSGGPYALVALLSFGVAVLASTRTKKPTPKPPTPKRQRALIRLPRFAFDRFAPSGPGFVLDAPLEWIEVPRLPQPEPWIAHVVAEIERAPATTAPSASASGSASRPGASSTAAARATPFGDPERAAVTAALHQAIAFGAANDVDCYVAFARWDDPFIAYSRVVPREQLRGLEPGPWMVSADERPAPRIHSFTTRSGVQGVAAYRRVGPLPTAEAGETGGPAHRAPDLQADGPARADFAFAVDDEVFVLSLAEASEQRMRRVLPELRELARRIDHRDPDPRDPERASAKRAARRRRAARAAESDRSAG